MVEIWLHSYDDYLNPLWTHFPFHYQGEDSMKLGCLILNEQASHFPETQL